MAVACCWRVDQCVISREKEERVYLPRQLFTLPACKLLFRRLTLTISPVAVNFHGFSDIHPMSYASTRLCAGFRCIDISLVLGFFVGVALQVPLVVSEDKTDQLFASWFSQLSGHICLHVDETDNYFLDNSLRAISDTVHSLSENYFCQCAGCRIFTCQRFCRAVIFPRKKSNCAGGSFMTCQIWPGIVIYHR